ncbi:MAG TPA: hypothetical protein VF533_24500 [Solirubrobacteraceae bacterium]
MTQAIRGRLFSTLRTVPVIAAVMAVIAWRMDAAPAAPVGTYVPPGPKFSLLDRPPEPADDVTSWAPSRANPDIAPRFREARVIQRDATRIVAAVPAKDGPCLLSRSPGGRGLACGGAPGRYPVSAGYDGGIGLVPDEVKVVTFEMTDGSVVTRGVVDNVWRSPVEAEKVTFIASGRVHSVELMPRSSIPPGVTIGPDGVASGGTPPKPAG